MLQTLNLPDWVPWWAPLALLVPVLLWALCFLFMPFSVFGVKSRLESIEARLDELQNEIRHTALRPPLSSIPAAADFDDGFPLRMPEQRPVDRIMTPPRRIRNFQPTLLSRTGRRRIPIPGPSGAANRYPGSTAPNLEWTGGDRTETVPRGLARWGWARWGLANRALNGSPHGATSPAEIRHHE